jgi:hypothetical protein
VLKPWASIKVKHYSIQTIDWITFPYEAKPTWRVDCYLTSKELDDDARAARA